VGLIVFALRHVSILAKKTACVYFRPTRKPKKRAFRRGVIGEIAHYFRQSL
jgi:hypothetical protein